MGKIYSFVFLLLWSLSSFAQNRFLQPLFTTPDSTYILDYSPTWSSVLSYKQTGNSYTYYLANLSNGITAIVPYSGGFNRGRNEGVKEHPHAWVTATGVLIEGEPLDSSSDLAPLYEWYQYDGTLTKLADSARYVSTDDLYAAFYSQNGPNSGLMLKHLGGPGPQRLVDSTVYGVAVYRGTVVYSTGKYLYSHRQVTQLLDQLTPSNGDPNQPGYFYSLAMDNTRVFYLSHRQGSPTRVHTAYADASNSGQVLFTEGDAGGNTDVSMEITRPVLDEGRIGGINLTSPYLNNIRGDVYTQAPALGFRNVMHIQTGTNIEFARVVAVNDLGDIAVKTLGQGNAGTYIISQDGSYNKKIADSTNWLWTRGPYWTAAIGPTLYNIKTDTAVVHHATPIYKKGYTRNKTPIPGSDFASHIWVEYPNTGVDYSLQFVQIVKRPSHGVLLNKNNQPIYNNTIIARADLDTLKYSASSLPGKDTVDWRAFDGTGWTNVAQLYFDIAQAPDTIKPFERNTFEGTPIRFWASQFKQHYVGNLRAIRVNRLPAYGKLTIGGKQLFYERSTDVSLAEIDSMYYTPYPNIIGVDTLQWMAYNDTALIRRDTPVILRVYPHLNTPPVLRTLESSYSKTADPDTILIVNYPRPQAHTDVLVWVDGTRMLPIAPGNTFVLDPATYGTGAHQLKVTFRHPLDSISLTRSFTITNALQSPMMAGPGEHMLTTGDIADELNVLPNPFSQQLTITGLSWNGSYVLRLYDAQGKLVLVERSFNQSRKVLQTGNSVAAKGVYYLQVYDMQSKTVIKTIKLLHL